MAEIRVEALGDDRYRVSVSEAGATSEHEVRARPEELRRYGGDAEAERLIEASFVFLLEREPADAILRRFELPVIERYFPDYPRRIRGYLG